MWITNRKCQYRMLGFPRGTPGRADGWGWCGGWGPRDGLSRVRKYASPELIEWFESHPRPARVS